MKHVVALAVALAWLPARADAGKATLSAAEVGAYVDSVVEAYGGAKKVDQLARYRIEGKVTAHLRGGTGTFRRDFVAPESLRVELDYPGRSEVRVLAGDKGWRGDSAGQRPVQGMPHTAMVYQMLRASAPWFMRAHRDKLVHATDIEADGALARVLRLKWSESLTVDYVVDDATRRVVKVEGTLSAGSSSMSFATQYSKFEKVKGVLVPHVEQSIVRGQLTGTSTVTKVTLGAKRLGPFAMDAPAKKAH